VFKEKLINFPGKNVWVVCEGFNRYSIFWTWSGKRLTMPHQLLFCTSFCGCLGNLKIPLVSLRSGFESYHGIFFPHTFFIRFIKFSSADEMSTSMQNFSPITFFCKEIFNVFCFRKNRFRIDLFNFEYLWCDLAKKISNGFWIYKTLNISLENNVIGLKFCMEVDISSADEDLIKRIKKVWGKKIPW
jgi:hypothetical protein